MPIQSFNSHTPTIESSAFIHETACVIGDVIIGAECSIWPMTVIRGDVNPIRIGQRTNIQDGAICHVTHDSKYSLGGVPLIIGDDVTVGHRVILHACTIENLILIGMGSIIMDEACVQSNVIVGAGSLVPAKKILESGYLWMGSPVKKIRPLTKQEIEFLSYSAKGYVELMKAYQSL